jgi:hypothetical protein
VICTAPCVPPCARQATFKLLNMRSRAVLGKNCDEHLRGLLGGPNQDYDKAPLDEQDVPASTAEQP